MSSTTTCAAPGCFNAAAMRCPTCVKLALTAGSHYCGQECFKKSWAEHKVGHKEAQAAAKAVEHENIKSALGSDSENTLSFSPRLAAFKVTPNPGEEKDKNFPRNLHNASEVFLRCGLIEQARQLHISTIAAIETLESGPDGKTSHSLGR